jgi:hypothetical protein
MSRPTKHVILKYRDIDRSSLSGSSGSPSTPASSASSSPVASSPKSDWIDLETAPVWEYIDRLYSLSLDEDEEWQSTAKKIINILVPLQNRWQQLEAVRKAGVAKSPKKVSKSQSRRKKPTMDSS